MIKVVFYLNHNLYLANLNNGIWTAQVCKSSKPIIVYTVPLKCTGKEGFKMLHW